MVTIDAKMDVKKRTKNIACFFVAIITIFSLIEIGYRALDPFPYISRKELSYASINNHKLHGDHLIQYDQLLGYKGIPNADEMYITPNCKTNVKLNRFGFRDIEHINDPKDAEVIAFLGDSYTWGQEVGSDEMFVNRLRNYFNEYIIYNLSHPGYGTDQSLLTLQQWPYKGLIKLVVLMFNETDIQENNSSFCHRRQKPLFEIVKDKLIMTNVPVPYQEEWNSGDQTDIPDYSINDKVLNFFYRSHFVHDITSKFKKSYTYVKMKTTEPKNKNASDKSGHGSRGSMVLTERILQELRDEVAKRNAALVVMAIPPPPAKVGGQRYQLELEKICKNIDVEYFDLTPFLRKTFFRTYHRIWHHLNPYGHKVVSEAMKEYFVKKYSLETTGSSLH